MDNTYRTNLLEATGSENVFKEIDPDEIEVSSITDDLKDRYRIPSVPSVKHTEKKLEGGPFFERYKCYYRTLLCKRIIKGDC